jgi:hypothetical protein
LVVRICAFVLFAAMLAGCSHVHPGDPTSGSDVLDNVNSAVAGRTVEVKLRDDTELWGKNVTVGADSTCFELVGQPSHSRTWRGPVAGCIPSSDIETMTIRRQGRGALEGGTVGLMGGFALGALVGLLEPAISILPAAAVVSPLGAVPGIIYGALTGSKDVYDFRRRPSRD